MGGYNAMNTWNEFQHLRGWVKLAAVLILLAGLLLGGILAPPSAVPVQAINAPPPVTNPQGPVSSSVNGTLASFTALIPDIFTTNIPFITR
jgi:hypothetical protein